MKTIPVPEKTVPDYAALVTIHAERGAFLVPPSINSGAARQTLNRHGLTILPVYSGGTVAAYRVQTLTRKNTKKPEPGTVAACKYCDQDIQFLTKWIDRGGNRQCVPNIKNGEIIKPRTMHAPYKG